MPTLSRSSTIPCLWQLASFSKNKTVTALQADFIVPSSREAVDCDSAWNEVLREQVPSLFLQALHSFRQLPAADTNTPMAWVNRWLQSIPLPREVRCFLSRVPMYCMPLHQSGSSYTDLDQAKQVWIKLHAYKFGAKQQRTIRTAQGDYCNTGAGSHA